MIGVTNIELAAARLSAAIYPDGSCEDLEYYKRLKSSRVFDEIIVNDNATVGLRWLDDLIPGKNCLVVCHEGTNDSSDAISDIQPGTRAIPGFTGRARKGFYLHARATWRPVRRYIREHRPESILYTGHSLGATSSYIQAALSMGEFAFLQNTMYSVTFGAPRCFDADAADVFEDLLNGRHTRFVSPSDPVCRVPTMFKYRHPNGRFLLEDEGYRDEIENAFFAWSNNTWNLAKGTVTLAKHHSMRDYLNKVKEHPVIPEDDIVSPTDGFVFV